jgi:uncharacterized protein (DUF2141 family)
MNTITISLAALLLAASSASAATLTVIVDNVTPGKGDIRASVFANKDDWLKSGVRASVVKADNSSVTIEFADLAPGQYAVSVIDDLNANGELDKGAFGKPVEPYGFSNNARPMFSAPEWEDAMITLPEAGATIHIKVK